CFSPESVVEQSPGRESFVKFRARDGAILRPEPGWLECRREHPRQSMRSISSRPNARDLGNHGRDLPVEFVGRAPSLKQTIGIPSMHYLAHRSDGPLIVTTCLHSPAPQDHFFCCAF